MTLGAALGNELFFITFMPFLFWEADASVARRVVLQWGVAYYVGQALKDVLMLPRPPAAVVLDNAGVESVLAAWRTPRNLRGGVEDEGEDDDAAAKRRKRRGAADAAAGAAAGAGGAGGAGAGAGGAPEAAGVVRLERHYETEGGMPSTHAMNAVSMPWLIVLLGSEGARAAFGTDAPLVAGAAAWTLLCVSSRLYLGVHSPADLVVGVALGLVILALNAACGAAVEAFVLHGASAFYAIPACAALLAVVYPRPQRPRWISTPGDTALILGCVAGVSFASRLCVFLGATDASASPGRGGGVGTLCRVLLGFLMLVLTRAIFKPLFVGLFEAALGKEFAPRSEVEGISGSRSLGGASAAAADGGATAKGEGASEVADRTAAGVRRRHVKLAYDGAAADPTEVADGGPGQKPKLRISVPPPAEDDLVEIPAGNRYAVELPTKFFVYFAVGFNCLFTCKLLFQEMGPLGKDFGLMPFA